MSSALVIEVVSHWDTVTERAQQPVPEQLRLILSKPPREPLPEQFGLSRDELKRLERANATREHEWKIWQQRLFWLFLVATVAAACLLVIGTNFHAVSVSAALMFGLIIFTSLPYTSRAVAARIIPPIPPDARFKKFRVAQEEFLNACRPPQTVREEADHARREYEREQKERERNRRTSGGYWRNLDGLSFECEVAALLSSLGHKVTRVGQSGDGGIDLYSDGIPVQCKQHAKPQGPAVVREFIGACKIAGAKRGILIATAGVTAPARRIATEHNLDVIDAGGLARMASEVPPCCG
jgi:hypothetical protein